MVLIGTTIISLVLPGSSFSRKGCALWKCTLEVLEYAGSVPYSTQSHTPSCVDMVDLAADNHYSLWFEILTTLFYIG